MDQEEIKKEKNIHRAFLWGIVFKGAVALAEMILGVLFLFIDKIKDFFVFLINSNPEGNIAIWLQKYIHFLPAKIPWLIIFYVFSRGFIKVFLIIGLLRKKLWTYPASIVIMFLFMIFQIYELIITGSIWLVILTVIDIVIVWLIWAEYLRLKVVFQK